MDIVHRWNRSIRVVVPLVVILIAGELKTTRHDDVMKWKHFPRHWPFVRGIHWSSVNSLHKGL